jgi:hypothetical protein
MFEYVVTDCNKLRTVVMLVGVLRHRVHNLRRVVLLLGKFACPMHIRLRVVCFKRFSRLGPVVQVNVLHLVLDSMHQLFIGFRILAEIM